MATVKTDSLILVVVVVLRKGYTAEVSATMRFVLFGNFFEASNEVALLRQGLGPAYFHPHRINYELGVKSAFAQPALLLRCSQ
jgi:hypothetical protein